jgi:drug/metabolite transporter (DMT)-like permease
MTAMQRFAATRVAPPMFVLETALPVALAPLLFGERWSHTAGGGAVLTAGLVLVLAGGVILGRTRAIRGAVH